MEEIWKSIRGYEGRYEVSNHGRVRSLNYHREKRVHIISQATHKKGGYKIVVLCDGKETKRFRVHRLVAEAFIDNPLGLEQINHKDENTANNRVENLEWCDCAYNVNYGNHNRKVGDANSTSVIQFSISGDFIAEFNSITEASERTGASRIVVCRCCNGKGKTAGGYVWKHKEVK